MKLSKAPLSCTMTLFKAPLSFYMKSVSLVLFISFTSLVTYAQPSYVRLVTNKGNITLRLYDETPQHKAIFLEGIKKGWYKNAAFNRVIKSFVSQAGELDETILDREKLHPELPLQRIPAEIRPDLFHKKGALGAGRNDNPEKSSYFKQIYLVAGKKQTDAQLDELEAKSGRKFTTAQREIYKTQGGTPRLDGDYTVFGEIVEGMAVADRINEVPTSKTDMPVEPVVFKAYILSKKEAAALWKLNP